MADFKKALAFMLPHEGGECDVAGDMGGHTNWGITQVSLDKFNASHPDLRFPANVHDLTLDNATTFYRIGGYWKFDGVHSDAVGAKIFDLGVNFGVGTVVKMVQSILNTLGASLMIDGGWGPRTETSVNAVDPDKMVSLLCIAAAARYRAIVTANPTQAKFLKGWLRRAEDVPHV